MRILVVNGKKLKCPSCYEELTTGQYQRALFWDEDKPDVADKDFFQLFSILTGTDYAGVTKTPANEMAIWDAIGWFITQPFAFKTELPKVIQVGEKRISLPRRMGHISIGQNIHLRRLIEQSKYLEENISMAVAIAIQPLYDEKPFDIERARELEKIILEMPIYLTHPIGFFLLQTAARFGQKRTRSWRRIRNNLATSFERMWQRWLKLRGSARLMTYH